MITSPRITRGRRSARARNTSAAKHARGANNDLAPQELRALTRRINKGAAILDRLLSASRMRRSWREIDKRIRGARSVSYERLWAELLTILQRSRKEEPPRAKVKKNWQSVAAKARELAACVGHGLLDLRIFKFYPHDVACLVFSEEWRELDQWEQQEIAHRVAVEWPTLPELLEEVAARAESLSASAMTDPRLVERVTADRQLNYFIRGLAEYFKANLGGTMNGTLAAIASVIFETDVGADFVKRALRQ